MAGNFDIEADAEHRVHFTDLSVRPVGAIVTALRKLTGIQIRYMKDSIITPHATDFEHDPRLRSAMEDFETFWGVKQRINWRLHVSTWAAQYGLGLPGDFVEFGTGRARTAHAIARFCNLQETDKRFWLFDRWEDGDLSEHFTDRERQRGVQVDIPPDFERTREFLKEYKYFNFIKGLIPETLEQANFEKACFAHIDLNYAKVEEDVARFIWPKMSPGSFIVLDDFNFQGRIEQRETLTAVFEEFGAPVLALPTGQGLVRKP